MIISILEQSSILGIMVLGVYISYKILDFPDLSVDGTFPLGASIVAACLIHDINPYVATLLGGIAGAIAGAITGLLHVKLKITNLLAGIIVMTGLYSINLRIMKKSNIPLFGSKNILDQDINSLLMLFSILIIFKFSLDFFFKTKIGFLLRALGDNENLISSLGIDEKKIKIFGLALSNFLVAISGGIFAQYQGFSDVGMGTGTIITALASIILGEILLGKIKLFLKTTIVIIGTVFFKSIIAFSLELGLNASDLKLLTACIVCIIIGAKEMKKYA